MPTPTATAEEGFPLSIDGLLGGMLEMLKEGGHAREIAILAVADVRLYQSHYDNWNGGTTTWGMTLALNVPVYGKLNEIEREDAAKILSDAADVFFQGLENDNFARILIQPRAQPNDRWRAEAAEYASGAGINNQGRVRSENLASRECDGLLFRSEPEIHLYRALKSIGVTFAPLPVFLRGGPKYARLEPDFVVLKDGVVMVIEVDGDTFHRELPAEAHARLAPLDHEGAKVERVRAAECATAAEARACAERLMKVLEKRIAQRH